MPILVTNRFRILFQVLWPLLFLVGVFYRDINYESLQSVMEQGPGLCFIHRWTGLLCPGCGMTRAMISFFCFNLGLSYQFHPMGPVLGIFVFMMWGVSFYVDLWPRVIFLLNDKIKEYVLPLAVTVIAWGVYRNL